MQLIPISCCFLPQQPFVPTSCSGCVWVTKQERGWQDHPMDPPFQISTFSISTYSIPLLPSKESRAWEMRMLQSAIDSFSWLLSHARAKTIPSLLATGWKKQLSNLCVPPVGRQQHVWAASPSSTTLHGVYIPSQRLLMTCLGMYK